MWEQCRERRSRGAAVARCWLGCYPMTVRAPLGGELLGPSAGRDSPSIGAIVPI